MEDINFGFFNVLKSVFFMSRIQFGEIVLPLSCASLPFVILSRCLIYFVFSIPISMISCH